MSKNEKSPGSRESPGRERSARCGAACTARNTFSISGLTFCEPPGPGVFACCQTTSGTGPLATRRTGPPLP
jgi:hypothetical protein